MDKAEAERILEHMARACKVREQSREEMLNRLEEIAPDYTQALLEVISQAEEALKYQDLDPRETKRRRDEEVDKWLWYWCCFSCVVSFLCFASGLVLLVIEHLA